MLQVGLSLFLFAHAAPIAVPQGRVLVVSHANGPFFDIQSAVDAASDRDTVLVKTGTYAGFTIVDKALNVVADTNASVNVRSLVQVNSLALGKVVVLVGLTVAPQGNPAVDALDLENDQGSVRVESCDFNGFQGPSGGRGAVVANSSDVVFTFSHVTSGLAQSVDQNGRAGLLASHSTLAMYDAESHGGEAGSGCPQGFTGGAGIDLASSFLFASRCRTYGGQGGFGNTGGFGCSCGADGGDGGPGLRLASGSTAVFLGGHRVGGPGGIGFNGGCGGADGNPGASVVGGVMREGAQDGRMLEIPNPVREVAAFPVTVQGRPGDRVYLYTSRETGFRYPSATRGVFLTQPSTPSVFLGTIGASGTLTTTLSFPDLGPGVDSQNEFLQAAVEDVTGSWILTDLSSLIVLDRAF